MTKQRILVEKVAITKKDAIGPEPCVRRVAGAE
jgi:hypothetical protein